METSMIRTEADWVEVEQEDRVLMEQRTGFLALKTSRRPRIVVAEDCEEIRFGLLRHLRRFHYLVHFATDGIEALRAIRDLEPDVLLLDLGLPRMHGFKVLHQLRRERIDLPVVVLTGDSSSRSTERALRFGVREVLLKPTPAAVVVASIDRLLRDQ